MSKTKIKKPFIEEDFQRLLNVIINVSDRFKKAKILMEGSVGKNCGDFAYTYWLVISKVTIIDLNSLWFDNQSYTIKKAYCDCESYLSKEEKQKITGIFAEVNKYEDTICRWRNYDKAHLTESYVKNLEYSSTMKSYNLTVGEVGVIIKNTEEVINLIGSRFDFHLATFEIPNFTGADYLNELVELGCESRKINKRNHLIANGVSEEDARYVYP